MAECWQDAQSTNLVQIQFTPLFEDLICRQYYTQIETHPHIMLTMIPFLRYVAKQLDLHVTQTLIISEAFHETSLKIKLLLTQTDPSCFFL